MEILIFKTDITSQKKAKSLSPIFRSVKGILVWHIDTKDIDNVLRIESENYLKENEIGYNCEVFLE